jgi:hypothetical protein
LHTFQELLRLLHEDLALSVASQVPISRPLSTSVLFGGRRWGHHLLTGTRICCFAIDRWSPLFYEVPRPSFLEALWNWYAIHYLLCLFIFGPLFPAKLCDNVKMALNSLRHLYYAVCCLILRQEWKAWIGRIALRAHLG